MMTLPSKLKELEIPKEDPFQNDLLEMKQYASTLKSIVGMYADGGGVIAINGDWGSGKTTFSRMWKQYLENNGFKTLYFNAWETDYYKDPLTAIIGELKYICKDTEKFKKFCSTAGKIGVTITKNVILSLLNNYTGVGSEAVKDICDSAENVLIDRIKDYEEEKSSIEDFKQSLSKYVADCGACPLVFIIDELDRCNPNYAVKLLETVKHIFDVPNIVFVLSICRKELENSIRGFYGSDRIDATNYLRRFIDIQFDVPHPKSDNFCKMLIQYYGFNNYFLEEPGGQNGLNEFYDMVALMFSVYDIDLRTWDRIFAHSRLAAIQLGSQAQLLMNLIFLLCFLRIIQPDFYSKIRSKEFSIQGLINELENTLPRMLIVPDTETYYGRPRNHGVILAITELLYIYGYAINGHNGPILSGKGTDTDLNLNFSVIEKDRVKTDIGWIERYMCLDKDILNFTYTVDLASNFKD